MDQMTISITQDDIDRGVRGNCGFCPLSRAAERAFKALAAFAYRCNQADYGYVLELGLNGGRQFALPKEAAYFIHTFDSGQSVEPLSFTLSDEDLITEVRPTVKVCGTYASKTGPDESQYKYERRHS